jgi:hypothetical protein
MTDLFLVPCSTGANDGAALEPALVGLRDRALIGVMVYTFARVNSVAPDESA